jgi:small subunit ribosomal protein S15
MALNAEIKSSVVKEFQRVPGDTGSSEVQVALLSKEINSLSAHLKVHRKDFHSRRGLMAKINRRRSLLQYLKNTNKPVYLQVVQKLELRN